MLMVLETTGRDRPNDGRSAPPAAWLRGPFRKHDRAMSLLGRILQHWRDWAVRPWIPVGARLLDIGCQQGEFLRSLGDSIGPSVGLDPLAPPETNPRYCLVPEAFREPVPFPDAAFDVVVLLATLKQIPEKDPLVRE